MEQFSINLPIVLFCYKILSESHYTEDYLHKPSLLVKVSSPVTLLMTFLVIHLSGFKCVSHYQRYYHECRSTFAGNFFIYGAAKLRTIFMLIPSSMMSWKILYLQRRLVTLHASNLVESDVFDTDAMALVSHSHKREGSEYGHSKRFKGRPLLQLSASFIGKIFVDATLFTGSTQLKNYLPKAVKRARSLGYHFKVVRADSLYGDIKNLLFLEKLSLSYVIGMPTRFIAIKKGKKLFEKLARKKSSKIVHICKAIAVLDLGMINVANNKNDSQQLRRVILCRRIHRRKVQGKWKVKKYFYALVTNLEGTPRCIFKLYQQRQCIENGFKELRYHYNINDIPRTGCKSLKANELWIVSKIFAMTIFKIFAENMLSKRLRSMRRKTLLRYLFATTISHIRNQKVVLRPKHQHLWHLKRILSKLNQNSFLCKPFAIVA